jgi:hypothetical protein
MNELEPDAEPPQRLWFGAVLLAMIVIALVATSFPAVGHSLSHPVGCRAAKLEFTGRPDLSRYRRPTSATFAAGPPRQEVDREHNQQQGNPRRKRD